MACVVRSFPLLFSLLGGTTRCLSVLRSLASPLSVCFSDGSFLFSFLLQIPAFTPFSSSPAHALAPSTLLWSAEASQSVNVLGCKSKLHPRALNCLSVLGLPLQSVGQRSSPSSGPVRPAWRATGCACGVWVFSSFIHPGAYWLGRRLRNRWYR